MVVAVCASVPAAIVTSASVAATAPKANALPKDRPTVFPLPLPSRANCAVAGHCLAYISPRSHAPLSHWSISHARGHGGARSFAGGPEAAVLPARDGCGARCGRHLPDRPHARATVQRGGRFLDPCGKRRQAVGS